MTDTATGRRQDAQEPSMDDILASIRRILAEDGAAAPEAAAQPRPAPPAAADDDPDAYPEPASAAAHPGQAAPETEWAEDEAACDPLSEAPEVAGAARAEAPADALAGVLAGAPQDDVFMLSPEMRADAHKVVSPQAADDSTDVLSRLARAILDRRDIVVATRDVTLESMVREMLRPLLREWLDRNLPYLIERLVRKEIDLMVNRAERLED